VELVKFLLLAAVAVALVVLMAAVEERVVLITIRLHTFLLEH
jgi:hypothetical protein